MIIRFTLAALLLGSTAPVLAARDPGPVRTNAVKTDPRIAAEFKARDTNHDGVLTKREIAAGIARMRVSKGPTAAAQTEALTDLFMSRTDANGDGKVTLAEMQGQMAVIAAKMDTNHDGIVSREEQRAAQQRMLQEANKAPGRPATKGR